MNNQLTEEDIKKLREEVAYRNTKLRFEIAKEKMVAAAFGDRSENAEYKAASQRYYENNRRIAYLTRMIKSSVEVPTIIENGKVSLGSKVTIKFLDSGETDEITLDTIVNADPMESIISIDSPLGSAIIGKSIGDVVDVEFPNGLHSIVIVSL